MKKIILFLLLAASFAAHGQYGSNPNKIRLGNQTSGDGLVYRGSGAPAYTPTGVNNAWVYIDTLVGRMYTYRGGAWEYVSAGAGVDSLALSNDTLYIYSPDTTFFVVIDRTITVAGSSGTPQTVDPGQTVTISNGFGITTTAGATRTVEVKADTSVLASKTYTANALALKLNLSDTATMLSPYQRDISLTTTGTSGAATFSSNILNIPQYQAALTNPVTGTGTTNYLAKFTGTSAIGNSLIQDDGTKVTVGGTAAIKVPTGTTVQRPGTPVTGEVRYNTDLGLFEGYGAFAWLQKSFPAGTTSQTIRHDGTSWVASSNLYHDGTGVGIGATSLGSARLVLKNSQEPARSTVVATQGFAADTTNWTKGTGWTFSGTTAVATGATGDLTYTPALTIISGNAYEVTYTISSYSAGTLTLAIGNATYALPTYNLTGNVVVVLPTSATGGFRFTTSTFTGVLDNVTVVQIANPAPVLFAGQDDGATTLYNSVRMPNSNTWAQGGGGGYTTGGSNNFFGYQAGYSNTTGLYNNFFGYQAGYSNTTGGYNNFFGYYAGYSNTTGGYNNFFGYYAGYSNTTGLYNNFFGNQAGRSNTTGGSNNFFGYQAGYSNTTGLYNNFFGYQAGYSNTTGLYNNFFGYQAGRSNTTGLSNNFFGENAGYSNTTGGYNNFFGENAGYSNTTGGYNNFFGYQAGYSNTTGLYNNFFGYQAGRSNTTGLSNNFFGENAGRSNTTGLYNNFFGENAGYSNTTGGYNNFFGYYAGYSNTTGLYNNFFGYQAGYSNTTGGYNNFFGENAGRSNTTGLYNNFFGYQAGYNPTTGDTLSGDRNILIGYQVGNNIRFDADNNVAIGYDIDLPVQEGDNQLVLSNLIFGTGASGTGTTTAGKVGIRTNAPNRELEVAGEVRITDLTTDTPTRIVGADADGDLAQIRVGSEIGIGTGDTLKILQQGATSGQALAWNGSNWRPTTISTSNIYSADGTLTGNRTLTGGAYTLTLTRDSSLVELGTTNAKLGYKDPANPFNLANITASREQVNVLVSNSGVSNTTQFTIQEDSVFFVGIEESAAYNYALPHKSPSVTSGAKSLMEWTGNGTGSGVNFTTTLSSSYLTDVIKVSEDSFNMGDDNQLTLVSSSQAAGAPQDNAFGMLVPFKGTSANVNWQIAGLATGSDALRMWMRAEGVLGNTNWRRIALWKDGEDAGSVDVSASGDNITLTLDTNAVTTNTIATGAVTSAKLATGAVSGAAYGTVYYVPVDSINYDATTDLATYSEIHYYMYVGAGATANQVLTVPAASSTYAGKKIYVVCDDADQTDAYGLAVTSSSGATIRYYSGGDTGFSDNATYGAFGHGEGPNAVLFVCIQNPRTLAYRWVAYDGIRSGY